MMEELPQGAIPKYPLNWFEEEQSKKYILEKVLISREIIYDRIRKLAEQIFVDFKDDEEITIIPIMTGSLIFVSDLIRNLPIPLKIDMVSISSYPGKAMESQGVSLGEVPKGLEGKNILVVDDILDSGRTLSAIHEEIMKQNPKSLKSAVLLRKKLESQEPVDVEYIGFDIPDSFVVGYGLDYDGYYRNLPDIMTLTENGV